MRIALPPTQMPQRFQAQAPIQPMAPPAQSLHFKSRPPAASSKRKAVTLCALGLSAYVGLAVYQLNQRKARFASEETAQAAVTRLLANLIASRKYQIALYSSITPSIERSEVTLAGRRYLLEVTLEPKGRRICFIFLPEADARSTEPKEITGRGNEYGPYGAYVYFVDSQTSMVTEHRAGPGFTQNDMDAFSLPYTALLKALQGQKPGRVEGAG